MVKISDCAKLRLLIYTFLVIICLLLISVSIFIGMRIERTSENKMEYDKMCTISNCLNVFAAVFLSIGFVGVIAIVESQEECRKKIE